MNESSTLVYLVHQIQAEIGQSPCFGENESDEQVFPDSCGPSAETIRRILDFDRILQVGETQSMGKIEWLLN